MTYRDELNKKTSYQLYCMVTAYVRKGGDLDAHDTKFIADAGESHHEDESDKEALADLVERLHDDDLI